MTGAKFSGTKDLEIALLPDGAVQIIGRYKTPYEAAIAYDEITEQARKGSLKLSFTLGEVLDEQAQTKEPRLRIDRELVVPSEILEAAADIASDSDVLGLERTRLEELVRTVLEMDRENSREAFVLLDLIDAEFRTDPLSTQCFDARIVERVKACVAKHKGTRGSS